MAVQVSYPGVYIEEFAPGAPIQGVTTSTGGLVGIAQTGPINTPTMVTSWDVFKSTFGAHPQPGFTLFYAARGFFQNNGKNCYIVRASNGRLATWNLTDQSKGIQPATGQPVVQAATRQPGLSAVTITTAPNHLLTSANTPLYKPAGALATSANGGLQVTLAADGAVTPAQVAGRFKPGDTITIAGGNDQAQILSVNGATLRLGSALTQNYAAGAAVRLADAPSGTLTIRLHPVAALLPGMLTTGSILTVTQGANTDTKVVATVQTEILPEGGQTYRVTFTIGLSIPLSLDPAGTAATVQSQEIDLTVKLGATSTVYPQLSMDPTHPRYLVDTVNADPSGLISLTLITPPPPGALPNSLPLGAVVQTDTGANENLATLVAQNFIDAINSFEPINDVNFIGVPDRPTAAGATMLPVQQALIAHCENMGDRFAILDSNPGAPLYGAGSVEEHRHGVESVSGYAALYYPWLQVLPDTGSRPVTVPPCGHIAGIFARVDNARGVYKAPANEIVADAIGVERRMSMNDLGQLNLQGIDVINVFQNGGQPVIWGGRTTAVDTNWLYISTRRLFLYLEVSIQQGIFYAVWEPNNLQLWQKLKRSISDFLTRAWQDGALFGAKPADAFYVRIDEVLNPFAEQQLGRLHIEIGVRPTYPAEFIIVRIGIWDGGAQVTEGA